jgi:hypothetical protein
MEKLGIHSYQRIPNHLKASQDGPVSPEFRLRSQRPSVRIPAGTLFLPSTAIHSEPRAIALRLGAEQAAEAHQEAEVSFNFVLTCHKSLLTVLLFVGNCYPDFGRGLDRERG